MKKTNKSSYWSLKIVLGLICVMALGSKANAQVLITWDSTLNNVGAVVTGNAVNGYVLASSGIEWEVGLWNSTVTTTDKASILNGFTSWKTQDAALYSGQLLGDGQFSGSNGSAAIPASWVGQPGTSFGIVFGRNDGYWGAFRFSDYVGGNIVANLAAPSAPAQQSGFGLEQIGVAYVPTGQLDSYVLSSVAIDLPGFGDQDPAILGNQFLQATKAIVLIPEPSSASLLALGMAGLVALRARRKS